jgi:hypothetical protein
MGPGRFAVFTLKALSVIELKRGIQSSQGLTLPGSRMARDFGARQRNLLK